MIRMTKLFLKVILLPLLSSAQQSKPIIDTTLLDSWPFLGREVVLSKNGRCVAFTISNQTIGSKTLIIQDIKKGAKQEIVSSDISHDFYFSHDEKKLCWKKGDSLLLQSTDKKKSTLIGEVSFYTFPQRNKGEWIAFKEKGKENALIVHNLVTGKQTIYQDCINAAFDDMGTVLLLQLSGQQNTLQWIDLQQQKVTNIWSSDKESKMLSFQFDQPGQQLAFIVNQPSGSSIYYYKKGMPEAIKRLDHKSKVLTQGLSIGSIKGFSDNGKWLFIKLNKPKQAAPKPDPAMVSVDIWSYRDEVLHPEQTSRDYLRSVNTTVDLVMEPANKNEGILLNPDGLKLKSIAGDYCILSSDSVESREYWWPHTPQPANWVASLQDGSRRKLPDEFNEFWPSMSPAGNWVICWNAKGTSWMSYEISTGAVYNISRTVPAILYSDAEYWAKTYSSPASWYIGGWFVDDSALLIYDNYDIWKVDPACRKPPVNITGNYGRENKTELRLAAEDPQVFEGTEQILLSGYNRETKYNGFLRASLNKPGKPEVLTMGPFTWYRGSGQGGNLGGMEPISGGDGTKSGWILRRESATEFPNYYYTRNFKEIIPVTNFASQKKCNWLTSELVKWTLPDGRRSQGVLYKPENFDSTKKYPVLFNYYEKNSYKLYTFQHPVLTAANINIPWFTSRGYLVFIPDIYYGNSNETGISSGRYALNAVESAADELCKRSYVNRSRMAIQGHSFGGLETCYILTHSKKFAAAAEAAGFTDVMSSYLTLVGQSNNTVDISSAQGHKERDHELYGVTPWEKPSLYLDNSPVWSADKASAPLLIMHNKEDNQVQWRQGVEMYMALRRLSKPCWMLQYDGESHVLENKKSKLDYTVRLTQFFDHYLKGKPAPLWMTTGVPAKLKQVENRYELDTKGSCAKDCKVCNKNRGKSK